MDERNTAEEGRSWATADDLWRYVWEVIAEQGGCDAWGGAECRRVTAKWIAAGRPVGVAEWILSRANEGPGPGPTA